MIRLNKVFSTFSSFYAPGYLAGLVWLLENSDYSVLRYLKKYWLTQDFSRTSSMRASATTRNHALMVFLVCGSLMQTVLAVVLMVYAGWQDYPEALTFGLALLVSYPVVWAHMLAALYVGYKFAWIIQNPKYIGRAVVCVVLENQVVRLRKKHKFTVVAVAGSVGKTLTKLAIARSLEPTRRVIYQTGNYNDRVTVPLVLFGHKLPNLLNAAAWIRIFLANEKAINRPNFYDIAVLELGTDHPGDMRQFAYLKPDIAVITAITPEHMEYFGTLDAVASEELQVCDYSKTVLVNADDTPARYLQGRDVMTFGSNKKYDFHSSEYKPNGLNGGIAKLHLQHGVVLSESVTILGDQGIKIVLAAAAAAQLAGLSKLEIGKGLKEVKPFAGRMQILRGIKDSTIIDDTYNASPVAVKAALDVLYATESTQRIAILGNMNELGEYSRQAHTEVGSYCRPDKIDLLVTIGPDANSILAPVAKANGCNVEMFDNPYQAGKYVRKYITRNAIVLAEGSQNRVFAEEAVKLLLANPTDANRLVRQSKDWLAIKSKQFPS